MLKILFFVPLFCSLVFSQGIFVVSGDCEFVLLDMVPEKCIDNSLPMSDDNEMNVSLDISEVSYYVGCRVRFTPITKTIYELTLYNAIRKDSDYLRQDLMYTFSKRLVILEAIFGKYSPTERNRKVYSDGEVIYEYSKRISNEKYKDTVYSVISLKFIDSSFIITETYKDYKTEKEILPKEVELYKNLKAYQDSTEAELNLEFLEQFNDYN